MRSQHLAFTIAAALLMGCGEKDEESPRADTACPETPDADGDGFPADEDCDDTNWEIHPGAIELCNDVDDDCDGRIDEDAEDMIQLFVDADRDGYGDPDAPALLCKTIEAYVEDNTDCDDTDAEVYPGAEDEYCDGVDSDCAGDDDYDQDGDGDDSEAYGGTDCDDSDASIYLGADEVDGTVDNDCDGEVEEMPEAVADYDSIDLTVTDEGDTSDTDTVELTLTTRTSNNAPVADAGSDQTISDEVTCTNFGYGYACDICADQDFTLDGSGIIDDDGEQLDLSWSITSGAGSFDDDTAQNPIFTATATTAPTYGSTVTDTYVLQVTVTDCYGDTDTDTVTLNIECTGN